MGAGGGVNAPGRKDEKKEKRRGSALSLEGVRLGLYSSVISVGEGCIQI